jgi:hypothetical protein
MLAKFRRLFILPYFPVIAAPFLLYAFPLFSAKTLFWGLPALQFIPWQAYAWQQISQGILPLWNPLNGMGTPFLANYQLALFYPPTWLSYAFMAVGGVPAMAWAQTFLVPLHLAWAGVGMARLAGRIGLGRLPQTIAGLAFGLSGYMVARSGFYTMIWAGAWLPWVVWAASAFAIPIRDGGNPKRGIIFPGLVICIALQLLAGHAQLSWYTLVLAGIWVVVGGWVNGGWKGALRSAGILAVNGLIGAGIAAIQLLPTAEYLLQSQRSAAVNLDTGLTYSFWPWRFLTLLAPDLFGNPGTGNYWGYASFWEDAAYIGMLPVLLALISLRNIASRGRSNPYRPLIGLAWILVIFGALLAMGKNTPVFLLLFHYVPTFSLFNAPARWMVWTVFGLALLAGISAESWVRPTGKALRRFRQLTFGAAAITIGAGAGWLVLRDIQVTFIEATALAGVWATGACLLTLYRPRDAKSWGESRWEWAVVAWLTLDLVWAGWSLSPSVPASLFTNDETNAAASAGSERTYLNGQDEYAIKFKRFFRFEDYSPIENWGDLKQVALPNMNLMPGAQFSYANNFDPMVPERFSNWMDWVDHLSGEEQARILPVMDVNRILKRDIHETIGILYQPVDGSALIREFSCVNRASNPEDAFQRIKNIVSSNDKDLAKLVILEGNGKPEGETCFTGSPGKGSIITNAPGKLVFEVDSGSSGIWMIANSWYPGWVASVDGVHQDLLHADYLFAALQTSPGHHRVELNYSPVSFVLGAVLSLFALMVVLIWYITHQHRVQ